MSCIVFYSKSALFCYARLHQIVELFVCLIDLTYVCCFTLFYFVFLHESVN